MRRCPMSDAAVAAARALASGDWICSPATVALWVHYGTAVFFETIRAGLVACFG